MNLKCYRWETSIVTSEMSDWQRLATTSQAQTESLKRHFQTAHLAQALPRREVEVDQREQGY